MAVRALGPVPLRVRTHGPPDLGRDARLVKETSVERRLVREVRAAGGDCFKFMPIVAGNPDRIVLLPPGRIFLVETKVPDGEVRPAQRVWHSKAAKIGVKVWLIWKGEQVTEWVAARMAESEQ